jgi:glycine/D-amino acid oxidase-like deaminating enzyme
LNIKENHLSFWERESFVNYDVIIVGAGISGLSTSISILERDPKLNVLVLEKSLFPAGASTKNAGFACFGSLSELISDISVMGKTNSLELVSWRWNGLEKLKARFTSKELGYENLGGYELFKANEIHFLEQLPEINEWLLPLFGKDVFTDVSSKISEFGFNSDVFKKMVLNPFEGQIDTGKTISSLWTKASKLGVKILTGAEVIDLSNGEVKVNSSSGKIAFKTQKIVVSTNAFTRQILPDLEIEPGRGQVLITQPINGLKLKGTFHMDEGYYYFRNVGNRLLIGGGRNLDFKGEVTTDFGINPLIDSEIRRIVKEEILFNQDYEVDMQWSGIMAFGSQKKPIIKWVEPNVLAAVRLGGMGMAIGTELGEMVAEMVIEKGFSKYE